MGQLRSHANPFTDVDTKTVTKAAAGLHADRHRDARGIAGKDGDLRLQSISPVVTDLEKQPYLAVLAGLAAECGDGRIVDRVVKNEVLCADYRFCRTSRSNCKDGSGSGAPNFCARA